MKKPIIGITLDLAEDCENCAYAQLPWYALRRNYADTIIKAGGVPLMIPYQYDTIEEVLDIIDGLIIPGGDGDIPPRLYNQENTDSNIVLDGQRAEFELKLLEKALKKDMPFLGICNGMQVLNVLMGGDLIQDITGHKQSGDKHLPFHPIKITVGTILSRLIDKNKSTIFVNSSHHQAIGKLGRGLIASAISEDGIVEAIESQKHKFVLGVEWHPEYIYEDNGIDLQLFKAFVHSCAARV